MTILPLRTIIRPLVLAAAALSFTAPASSFADDARGDDGWRRTAYGWEHVADWQTPRVNRGGVSDDYVPPLPKRDAQRCDVHPAVLLVLQLLGVGIAVIVRPQGKVPRSNFEIQNNAMGTNG